MAKPVPSRAFRVFCGAYFAYTIAVIVWGALVRATGSGAGCGDSWPDCRGALVPDEAVVPGMLEQTTLIEWVHRATSGLLWWVALGAVVWAWRAFGKRHPGRVAAALGLLFMSTEALIGAGLVLFELVADNASVSRGAWIGAHLVNTFLLLACLTALNAFAYGFGWPRWGARSRGLWVAGLAALFGVLLVSVTGALTALADTLLLARGADAAPLPAYAWLYAVRPMHPLLALAVSAALVVFCGWLAAAEDDKQVRRWARIALFGVVTQVGIGLANVLERVPVWLQLLHLGVADLVWAALIILVLAVLAAPHRALVSEGLRGGSAKLGRRRSGPGQAHGGRERPAPSHA